MNQLLMKLKTFYNKWNKFFLKRALDYNMSLLLLKQDDVSFMYDINPTYKSIFKKFQPILYYVNLNKGGRTLGFSV
jgi:hypothetical protein